MNKIKEIRRLRELAEKYGDMVRLEKRVDKMEVPKVLL